MKKKCPCILITERMMKQAMYDKQSSYSGKNNKERGKGVSQFTDSIRKI
jgi:hypothetical protein